MCVAHGELIQAFAIHWDSDANVNIVKSPGEIKKLLVLLWTTAPTVSPTFKQMKYPVGNYSKIIFI